MKYYKLPLTINECLPRHVRISVQKSIDASLDDIVSEHVPSLQQELLRPALFPGRRLRPYLFYLLTERIPGEVSHCDLIATSVELCHRASIILDDFVDGDKIRRSENAFHCQFGTDRTALVVVALTGIATSCVDRASAQAGVNLRTHFSNTITKMAFGEISDIQAPPTGGGVDYYFSSVLSKTSRLFEFVFLAAAKLRKLSIAEQQLFRALGQSVGELYQVYNDLYDTRSPKWTRGMATVHRLTFSLPVAVALDVLQRENRSISKLQESVGKYLKTEESNEIFSLLSRSDIQERANSIANDCERCVENHISKIGRSTILPELSGFIQWIKNKNCWDQSQMETAGY